MDEQKVRQEIQDIMDGLHFTIEHLGKQIMKNIGVSVTAFQKKEMIQKIVNILRGYENDRCKHTQIQRNADDVKGFEII